MTTRMLCVLLASLALAPAARGAGPPAVRDAETPAEALARPELAGVPPALRDLATALTPALVDAELAPPVFRLLDKPFAFKETRLAGPRFLATGHRLVTIPPDRTAAIDRVSVAFEPLPAGVTPDLEHAPVLSLSFTVPTGLPDPARRPVLVLRIAWVPPELAAALEATARAVRVTVDGRAAGTALPEGPRDRDGWVWHRAGSLALAPGQHTLELAKPETTRAAAILDAIELRPAPVTSARSRGSARPRSGRAAPSARPPRSGASSRP